MKTTVEISDAILHEARRVATREKTTVRALIEEGVHGARELWTADRDFGRFPGLRVRNPLVG